MNFKTFIATVQRKRMQDNTSLNAFTYTFLFNSQFNVYVMCCNYFCILYKPSHSSGYKIQLYVEGGATQYK